MITAEASGRAPADRGPRRQRIRDDDRVSYRPFRSAAELPDVVADVRVALRAALERNDVMAAAAFARALWLFWYLQGAVEEHLPWIEEVLARTALPPRARLDLLLAALALLVKVRDVARTESRITEVEALAGIAPDDPQAPLLASVARGKRRWVSGTGASR